MMRRIAIVSACAAAAMLSSCGPTKSGGGGGGPDGGGNGDGQNLPHILDSVLVTPGDQVLQLDINSPASVGFTAMAHYEDGATEDITAQATWANSNSAAGTIDATGALSVPGFPTATAVTSVVSADYMGLEGKAQITIAAYRKSGPTQDFFFILPYQDTAGNSTKPLDFSTTVPALDVFFLMDTTGSMGGEINNLTNALTSVVIPGIQAAAATTQFGVGAFEDFPNDINGSSNCFITNTPDQPLHLFQTITPTVSLVQAGIAKLKSGSSPRGCGYDEAESGVEAIYQVATHEGLNAPSPTNVPNTPAGFHSTSMPVIVAISDAPWHNGVNPNAPAYSGFTAHTTAQAETALHQMCGHVVGIAAIGNGNDSMLDMLEFANSTGSKVPPVAWDAAAGGRPAGCAAGKCCTGQNSAGVNPDGNGMCPLVFQSDLSGNGVSSGTVAGIQMLANFGTFDVTTTTAGQGADINGNPVPSPHTTADFLKSITPTSFIKPATPAGLPDPTFDTTQFHTVTPGTQVSFNVSAYNDFVPATDQAQIFKANISVLAGGCTPLDNRDVLILVPPTALPIGKAHGVAPH